MSAVVAFAIGAAAGRAFTIAVQQKIAQKIPQTSRRLCHRGLRDAVGR